MQMEMEMKDEEIRIWLTGKETNIRLLMSTLHHVSKQARKILNWFNLVSESYQQILNQTGIFYSGSLVK